MIYGYIRVSTDKQTVENQRFEIEGFAKTRGMIVENWTSGNNQWYKESR